MSRGVTRVAESEVVQMAIGEAAAAIDVATLLLHTGREASTAAVSSGRQITGAEALRARRDMVYAQHQVGWALDRLCEIDGARWVYDSDQLGAIRRDVMTILTHHATMPPAAKRRWRPTAACCSPTPVGEPRHGARASPKPSWSPRHPGLAQTFEKPLPIQRARERPVGATVAGGQAG